MTTTPRPPAAPPGLTVGGYALLTRIGEGGMGVVHLAQKPGGARVALKVLRPHIVGDDEARARLAREVGSLSRIRSPRVAEILDADPWGPVPFVATRYVPGLSLHDHVVEEGPIGAADLVWFATCLAEALEAVHSCGVLHRDIKPSNVLMEGRTPVLIDFGLARVADDPKLTHTGWLLGTPGYLAPEILHGEDATTASDIHSWAATVAYAGTGRAPFGRGPSMAIMDRVRRGEHQLDGLPEPLRGLVAAALDPVAPRRPRLDQILGHLRGLPAPVTVARRVEPADPFTLPIATAATLEAHQVTGPVGWPDPEAAAPFLPPVAPTRPETVVGSTAAPAAPVRVGPHEPAPFAIPTSARAPWLVRFRRVSLGLALAAVGTAAVVSFPYLGVAALVVAVWLLRSGSLAASAAGQRRQLRGLKWYDGPQTLLAAPLHLVQSIPGTFLLVLWAGGLGLAGGLLGYAGWGTGDRTRVIGILATAGLLFVLALWFGPGGGRVSGPLRRVLDPLADRPVTWLVALLLLLAAASGIAALATERGPDLGPFESLVAGR
ncbi:MAG: protein kinase [Nocardioidaceae bacterium]|nr:protein kinase [Nocardioidaceae bacterium]